MDPIQFFYSQIEHNSLGDEDQDYIEGYDYILQSLGYSIRSGEIKNIQDLSEILDQFDAYSEDFSGEYKRGYEDALERSQKILKMI